MDPDAAEMRRVRVEGKLCPDPVLISPGKLAELCTCEVPHEQCQRDGPWEDRCAGGEVISSVRDPTDVYFRWQEDFYYGKFN